MMYLPSQGFLENSTLVLLKDKKTFNNSYLSINVPISQVTDIYNVVKSEREKFKPYEPKTLQLYKDESLHFTLGATVMLENDPNVERIKEIIEPRKTEIIKSVQEEISKLRPFKIAAKFTKATEQSIFVFVSFEKDMEKPINNFQVSVAKIIYKVLEGTGVEKYDSNKPFGRPVNFARWNVNKLPNDAKVFFEQYTKDFTEEIRAEGEVKKAVLTYSDQAWSNPKENIIHKFDLK